MNENIINDIGNKVFKLKNAKVIDNYSDKLHLDLLIENLGALQKMFINNLDYPKGVNYLSILEKEIEYFLARYGETAKSS